MAMCIINPVCSQLIQASSNIQAHALKVRINLIFGRKIKHPGAELLIASVRVCHRHGCMSRCLNILLQLPPKALL